MRNKQESLYQQKIQLLEEIFLLTKKVHVSLEENDINRLEKLLIIRDKKIKKIDRVDLRIKKAKRNFAFDVEKGYKEEIHEVLLKIEKQEINNDNLMKEKFNKLKNKVGTIRKNQRLANRYQNFTKGNTGFFLKKNLRG